MGCIGAWATKLLLEEGADVAIFDLDADDRRLRSVIDSDDLSRVERISGDITDLQRVREAMAGRTHMIHLAALQVPMCRANPPLGAVVNVAGTTNVLENARQLGLEHLVYASSMAVFGHPRHYRERILSPDALRLPETLYGVFKVANEDTAGVYWHDHQVPSIGLRPYTVYGPLRDQGATSQPTLAIEAAVRGEPYHIGYGGTAGYQFAPDVARLFIMAARAEPKGAHVYSLSGDIVTMSELVRLIGEVTGTDLITYDDTPLPFPDGADDTPLRQRFGEIPHTPLSEAIRRTAEFFEKRGTNGHA